MLYLEIDVSAAIHNIEVIRKYVDAEINAVIKANCYGHGIELAKYIEPYVDSFSVATVSEAKEAMNIGLKKKIYILGAINLEDFEPLDNAIYTVCSKSDIDFLRKFDFNFEVAIKINSGMNRLGVRVWEFRKLFDLIESSPNLHIDSVFTHFYNVDEGSYLHQFDLFSKATDGLFVKKHCCASNCLRVDSKYHLDMVRCGLSIYGFGHKELIPVIRAYATVAQINHVREGECIGYGNFIQSKDAKIAIIRVGYADGYRRIHKNQYASANGSKRVPLVGQVSMDMSAVDISGLDIKVGDKIYIIDNIATAEALASVSDTIVYEILTGFNGGRIKRAYINIPTQNE